ncbi:MAG: formamidopyrimidine-DNA glycosylase [Gemmatimonadaceae bacterium]|jgi:formamidopyrimidine-DNA glycosylase|nr:formamidopyrimidine-DNA glycosylase [Gemmatimonadaceae bacterium]
MPELPDITVYIEALESKIVGETLEQIRIPKPFLLRSVDPPISAAQGKRVLGVRRMGKRIVVELEDDLFLVIHLMIAGRLRWVPSGGKVPGKIGLAAFDFTSGTVILTEAGSKRRASLWLVRGEQSLEQFERGGLEVLESDLAEFTERLIRENHTLKRSLTDPRLFSGVGNAYSDEILHRAKLSPVKHTRRLSDEEIQRLFDATQATLIEWTDRLRAEAEGGFPAKVTAFREEMAVHGKFGKPCPVCGTPVQRIRYADNETNYCPRCQTEGKLLADRALSRLLKEDWPRSIDELTWS